MRALAIAGVLIVLLPLSKAPIGFAAALLVAFLIMRRAGPMPAPIGSVPLLDIKSAVRAAMRLPRPTLAILLVRATVGDGRQER